MSMLHIVSVILIWLCTLFANVVIVRGENTISTPIKFNGQTYEINFPAETTGALIMAKKFCDEKAASANIAVDDINELCIRPIGKLLIGILEKQTKANQASTEQAPIDVVFEIAGDRYVISQFKPWIDSASTAAREFCQSNLENLQLNEETIGRCMDPVIAQLEKVISESSGQKVDSKPDTSSVVKPNKDTAKVVEVSFDGIKKYSISCRPKVESVGSVAKKFCIKYREELGVRFSEMKGKCIDVVENAFAILTDEL